MNEKYEIHERHAIQENILTEWTLRMMNNTLANSSIYFIDGNSSHFTGQRLVVVQLTHWVRAMTYYQFKLLLLPSPMMTYHQRDLHGCIHPRQYHGQCSRYQFKKCATMTSSNGNNFRVTGPLCGEFTGEFPLQRPVTRSFGVFFIICAWTNDWVNNRDAGDQKRHRALYGVIVISESYVFIN